MMDLGCSEQCMHRRRALLPGDRPSPDDEAARPLLNGSRQEHKGELSLAARSLDLAHEVVLPVCVMTLGIVVSCAALWVSVAHALEQT